MARTRICVHVLAFVGLVSIVMNTEEHVLHSLLPSEVEPKDVRSYPRGVADASLTWKDGSAPSGYLAICVVVKNNHLYMREWVEYHLWLGVGAIYLWWVHGGRRDVATTPTTRRRAREERSEHSGSERACAPNSHLRGGARCVSHPSLLLLPA